MKNEKNSGAENGGFTFSNISNSSNNYSAEKLNTPRGHGFAAENANHLHDKIVNGDFFGQDKVQLVGEEIDPKTGHIIKNGADRIVNGVSIQTKYCKTGSKCISECFENHEFRYYNVDGTPMQIEVPSDKYDAAVKAMEERIRRGEVNGVTDPEKAKEIIRKGSFTYEQAKNIAKAGTIESLTYDSVNGAIVSVYSFGISSSIAFATSIWNGDDFDEALNNATCVGLKVGGTAFATSVISGQLAKAGINSALVNSSEAIVKMMGPKASALLANAFRSGSNIYGAAAMNNVAKMLRSNAITAAVSVVVLSAGDLADIFRGRISGSQLFKNMTKTASTVAGGYAGWTAGAAAGAYVGSVFPIVGTAIGGFVGGLLGSVCGGSVSEEVTGAVLDEFIEDDAEQMVDIIKYKFEELAQDYLLTRSEAEQVVDRLQNLLEGSGLKDMYQAEDHNRYAHDMIEKCIKAVIEAREKIILPGGEDICDSLRNVLENAVDETSLEEDLSDKKELVQEMVDLLKERSLLGCIVACQNNDKTSTKGSLPKKGIWGVSSVFFKK